MQESRRPAVTETPGTDHDRDQPVVSVIVPTYNRAWSVRKTVESVFAQTYRPIECLIVDDGSTDETPGVAGQLTEECPEGITLRYSRGENGSANTARNRGLAESTGDYICFLDSDDLLLPDAVEVRARVLSGNPDVDLCYGIVSLQDEKENEMRRIGRPWPAADEARISAYLFHTMGPLMRRSLCVKAGPWRQDDMHGQEHEYFARLKYFARDVVHLDQVVGLYVRHERGSIFDDESLEFARAVFRSALAIEALILYEKYDCPAERLALSDGFKALGKKFLRLGDNSAARMAFGHSLSLRWTVKAFAGWSISNLLPLHLVRK